jgi:hypothetical protein
MQFSAVFSLIFKNDYKIINKNKRKIKCIDISKWRDIINLKLNNIKHLTASREANFFTHTLALDNNEC